MESISCSAALATKVFFFFISCVGRVGSSPPGVADTTVVSATPGRGEDPSTPAPHLQPSDHHFGFRLNIKAQEFVPGGSCWTNTVSTAAGPGVPLSPLFPDTGNLAEDRFRGPILKPNHVGIRTEVLVEDNRPGHPPSTGCRCWDCRRLDRDRASLLLLPSSQQPSKEELANKSPNSPRSAAFSLSPPSPSEWDTALDSWDTKHANRLLFRIEGGRAAFLPVLGVAMLANREERDHSSQWVRFRSPTGVARRRRVRPQDTRGPWTKILARLLERADTVRKLEEETGIQRRTDEVGLLGEDPKTNPNQGGDPALGGMRWGCGMVVGG